MEEIKKLLSDLILFGYIIDEIQLIVMVSLLYDKTFSESYDCIELNGNTLFTEKCLPYFLAAKKQFKKNENLTEIDNFIDHYKQLILKDEQYELINFLKL